VVAFVRFVMRLVEEKESKIREGMKIMGMSQTSYYLSWYISYSSIFTFHAVAIAIILKM